MNLILDIGNSLIKWAEFDGSEPLRSGQWSDVSDMASYEIPSTEGIKIGVAATGAIPKEVYEKFDGLPIVTIDSSCKTPLTNSYKSIETLGVDRLANAVASKVLYPGQNVLVIDLGTCITVDVTTSEGEYKGGSISPGVTMRYKAMHTFTDKLPLLEREEAPLIGVDTASSMHSGVWNGVLAELEGFIRRYNMEFDDLRIVITGGDGKLFAHALKSPIFADDFHTLKGLNAILDYQND